MDNKLSELSKPVGFIEQSGMDYLRSGEDADIWPDGGRGDDIPLYSQEYVSALLAERDAFKASALALRDEWRARGECIAELEERREQRDNELRTNAELEKRLATPVRLPGSFYPDGDIDCPLVVELDAAVEAIRAAGFTVEGDE
ncbi:hypothetical protein [Serratia marcescens]|uniref:hypothetical protein n=1 Tax=Serratia marcescens TaxID=615 RepID=UPI0027E44C07|nr:hypothetical protein [Serratia marcescens]MDI3229261.1 hypothetical protein [Serratia marcescens]